MKKLYNSKGAKRVHPSPPSFTHLSALPTALLALATALSAEEQEVLAYLLGCEKGRENRKKSQKNHPPELGCCCFGCYKSFWARWDASPNRHVIHLIIDAFEETLESKEAVKEKGRSRRRRSGRKREDVVVEEVVEIAGGLMDAEHVVVDDDDGYGDDDDDVYDDGVDGDDEGVGEGEEKSSVRRFVSWVFGIDN